MLADILTPAAQAEKEQFFSAGNAGAPTSKGMVLMRVDS
jgi:hypothetical protein